MEESPSVSQLERSDCQLRGMATLRRPPRERTKGLNTPTSLPPTVGGPTGLHKLERVGVCRCFGTPQCPTAESRMEKSGEGRGAGVRANEKVAQLVGASPTTPEGCGLDSQSGDIPRLQKASKQCFAVSLFLPSSLPKFNLKKHISSGED